MRHAIASGPRRGFTLLEAVVALAVIALVAIGVLQAFGAELRAAARAQELLPAAALAEERLAQVELVAPRELRHLPDSLARGQFDAPFERYRWIASAVEVSGEPALVEMSVVVSSADASYTLRRRRYRPLPNGASNRGMAAEVQP